MLFIFFIVGLTEANSNGLIVVIYALAACCTCILTIFIISLVTNIYLCTKCKRLTRSSDAAARSDHSPKSNSVQPLYDTILSSERASRNQELTVTKNVAYHQVQLTATPL